MRLRVLSPGALAAAALAGAPLVASAAAPIVVTTQGRLLDNSDQPVNGQVSLTVAIYGAADGEAQALWTGTYQLTVAGGLYSLDLGLARSGAPAFPDGLFDGAAERWMGVKVNGGSELQPRLRFGSAPAALFAARAERAGDSDKLQSKTLSEITTELEGRFDQRYLRPSGNGSGGLTLGGDVTTSGTFTGDGSGLTNLAAAQLTGTIADARLSPNVALLSGAQTFTGPKTFGDLAVGGLFQLPVDGARTSCATPGLAYFNGTDKALYVCDGSAWKRAGAAPGPRLLWNVPRLDFASTGLGGAGVERQATLQNDGAAAASGLSIGATNEFQLKATTCGDTLAAGATCTATFVLPGSGSTGARQGHGIAFSAAGGTPGVLLTGTLLGPDGMTPQRAARSCKSIHADYPAQPTGTYYLIKDGNTDPSQAYLVYCDMQTNGGGWTLVANLNTADGATRDYDDTAFWTGNTLVGTPGNFGGDQKSQAFLELGINTELLFVAHVNGSARGWAAYDLLPVAQGKAPRSWFSDFANQTITGARKANSGAVGTNGPRTGGDAFIDNPHAVIVNSTYSPLDAQNLTRLGTNYADRCGTINCNGHNYGGWGGRHYRNTWGAYYEGAQLNGYCDTYGGYGTNGRAYNGNNAFQGTAGGCSASSTLRNDLMIFVR